MTHPSLVETMNNPQFYPHLPEKIELVQTHISNIFIAGDYVYKVKKAVNFGFLDFSTLEKRKFYCYEELRLNRRLAPDVYLEVLSISENDKGNLVWGEGESVVEYAVKMKMLPLDRMLKKLLQKGEVDATIMEAIARKLSDFHKHAETGGRIDEIGGIDTVRHNHDENFAQTQKYMNITIPEYQYRFIKSYVDGFIGRHRDLFINRVAKHKIRDCHGDLHLEHICITDDIVIFDCIEFNERFRYGDVAAEVAFLAMDLDYNGFADYAEAFVQNYVNYTGDSDIRTLCNFYKCYYAYVRGKVISFRLDDKDINQEEQKEARKVAGSYFDLAYTYASRLGSPTLILMAGLMGTGKSLLAKNISSRLGAEIIRSDLLRKEILNIEPTEHHFEDFGKGIYVEEVNRKTYAMILEMTQDNLRDGKSVIIDASFKKRDERIKAYEAAQKLPCRFFVIECVCPEELIRKRLQLRMSDAKEVSDGRWEIFQTQKGDFDKITELPEQVHLIADTSLELEACANSMIEKITLSRV